MFLLIRQYLNIFRCPTKYSTRDLALYGRGQAVESLKEGGRLLLDPVGHDSLQVILDHLSSSGHRLEQFSGLAPHRVHPGAPGSEQLPGFLGNLPLIDALEHEPHLVGRDRYAPF